MQIKAEEISSIIKEKIKGFDQQVDVSQTGSVIQVGDGIAKIYGLDGAMAGEMLEFPGGIRVEWPIQSAHPIWFLPGTQEKRWHGVTQRTA